MIVYVDLIANVEVASDAFEQTEPIKGIKAIQSKRITIEEQEVDIGANASAEATEEDETVEKSEAKTVINVVHAASLTSVNFKDVKEYKKYQNAYWKLLLNKLNDIKYKSLGIKDWAEMDKDDLKEKEAEAKGELSKFEVAAYDNAVKAIATFKENFDNVNNWIKTNVIEKYDEFEFYVGSECESDSAMIIPARYEGEAVAPVFYFWSDGIKFKKE